jgi:hypothetical protein
MNNATTLIMELLTSPFSAVIVSGIIAGLAVEVLLFSPNAWRRKP